MTTTQIQNLLTQNPVILFMKGDKFNPKCGFSMNSSEILKNLNVNFTSYDILEDETLRQDLKEFSGWPTYPQLYIQGDLIGGNDIIQELLLNGELEKLLQPFIDQSKQPNS